jgi:hypothetical protein
MELTNQAFQCKRFTHHLTTLLILHQAISECKGVGVREYAWVKSIVGWVNYYKFTVILIIDYFPPLMPNFICWRVKSLCGGKYSFRYSCTLYHVYIFYLLQNHLNYNGKVQPLGLQFIKLPFHSVSLLHLLHKSEFFFFLHVVTFWGPQHTSRPFMHEHTLALMPKPLMKRP